MSGAGYERYRVALKPSGVNFALPQHEKLVLAGHDVASRKAPSPQLGSSTKSSALRIAQAHSHAASAADV